MHALLAPRTGPSIVDRQLVGAIVRGFRVLECFCAERSLLTNLDLARATGLPKSSVSRLTHTLVKLGYLEYDSTAGAYRCGLKVVSLHPAALSAAGIEDQISPITERLAVATGETVLLTIYEDFCMIAVRCDTRNASIDSSRYLGWRYPVYGTSMGHAHYAMCSRDEKRRIMEWTSRATTSNFDEAQGALNDDCIRYQQDGFCIGLGLARPGMHSIARSVNLSRLGRRAVISCGGQAHRLPESVLRARVAPLLMEASLELERAAYGRT
jgi:DNA-binding IclR family transcriptional regulator